MVIHVLVADPISNEGLAPLLENSNFDVKVKTKLPTEELIKEMNGTQALIVRSQTQVTEKVLKSAKHLKFVGRAGTGVDNIDVSSASKTGIVVANVPGGNTISAGEHALAMMFSLARNIPQAHKSTTSGKWEKSKFMGTELTGKTLAVLGLGRIGREVATRAIGLAMRVVAYDPFGDEAWCRRAGIKLSSIDDVLTQADFITIHMPKNEKTKDFINRETLSKTKKGVRIINCARGGILDESALLEFIEKGHVKGAALDVFQKEPLPVDSPLLSRPEIIVTPHLGASTEEAQVKVATELSHSIVEFFENGFARHAINLPPLDVAGQTHLLSYVSLSDRLGRFLSQIIEGKPQSLILNYSGEVGRCNPAFFTATAAAGFLSGWLGEKISSVNALMKAGEKGLQIQEQAQPEAKDYASLFELEVITDKGHYQLAGTVYGHSDFRLVRINDLPIDAIPEGTLLMMKNEDKPGVVGHTGMELSKAGINIAGMQVGRNRAGGQAISLWNIDAPLSEDTLKKMMSHPAILSVKVVQL